MRSAKISEPTAANQKSNYTQKCPRPPNRAPDGSLVKKLDTRTAIEPHCKQEREKLPL
jgi:hypothetical protein